MNARVNAFVNLTEIPTFEVKPKSEKPVAKEGVDRIADENGFPSRQARKPSEPRREPRLYRTGRNQHFGLKASNATIERYHKMADDRGVTLARLLELALDALDELERAGG